MPVGGTRPPRGRALSVTQATRPAPRRPRRQLLTWLALTVGIVIPASWSLLATTPTQAAGDCTVAASELATDGEEQAMLNGINGYRQQNGLPPLVVSPTLTRAAAWMSHDLAAGRYFSHTDSLGRSSGTRMVDCGYTTLASWWAENLAAGHADAASTLNQWKTSPGHNAALLDSRARAAGIGRFYDPAAPYGWYWTLD